MLWLFAVSPGSNIPWRSTQEGGEYGRGISVSFLDALHVNNFLQSGLAFSSVYLSGFVTSVFLTIFGRKLNARKMAFGATLLQGLVGICFGQLELVVELNTFLYISYSLR